MKIKEHLKEYTKYILLNTKILLNKMYKLIFNYLNHQQRFNLSLCCKSFNSFFRSQTTITTKCLQYACQNDNIDLIYFIDDNQYTSTYTFNILLECVKYNSFNVFKLFYENDSNFSINKSRDNLHTCFMTSLNNDNDKIFMLFYDDFMDTIIKNDLIYDIVEHKNILRYCIERNLINKIGFVELLLYCHHETFEELLKELPIERDLKDLIKIVYILRNRLLFSLFLKGSNISNHIILKIALISGDIDIIELYCSHFTNWKNEITRSDLIWLSLMRCENENSIVFLFDHLKINNLIFQESINELTYGLKYLLKERIINETNFKNVITKSLVIKYIKERC
jgi:hypothetical protein